MGLTDTQRPTHRETAPVKQARVITDLVTIRATAAETRGTYSLFETETPPSGGCPAHTQRYDDEAFYVLAGRYAVLIGEEQRELGPGTAAFVPRGTPHAYANIGPTPARMLILALPGGIQETFFDEIGDHADRPAWEPDMARVMAVAPKYGIEFLLPESSSGQEPAPWDHIAP